MQVTGGKILYNRSVQPAPYETKALGAEWSFSCEPGENPAEASKVMVRDMMTLVHTALGLIKVPEALVTTTAPTPEPAKATRTRKAKEPVTDQNSAAQEAAHTRGDDAEIIGGDVASPQTQADDAFVIEADALVQISDADLKSACAKTAQKLGDGGAVKVKEWAAKFRTDATKAFQVADITQAERQKFLDGLEKLT